MSHEIVRSEAFQRAELAGERVRIVGLIGALAAMLLLAAVRAVGSGEAPERRLLTSVAGLVGAGILYESAVLVWVRRVLSRGAILPARFWMINVAAETLLPTAGLVLLTREPTMGPYRSLAAPAVLVYFIFIILSTLRLSPALTLLSGGASALGYLGVLLWTLRRYPLPAGATGVYSEPVYFTFAALLCLGGCVGAVVAGQIRGHAGAALAEARKAERLHRDLEVARSIQQGLLPSRPPSIAGFDIAGWNRPADQTGGDHYDWLRLPDGKVMVTLADVTGHGIGPALMTAACRAYGRACFASGASMGEAMVRLNDLLAPDLPPGKLVTYVAGLLDPASGRVRLLSAGHGPLFIYRPGEDRLESFAAHGVPLGVVAGMKYPAPQEIDLAPGDLVVLNTDGFLEWENGTEEPFGTERFHEALRSARELPAAEVIRRLQEAVGKFAAGTEQQDDLTAVVVRRLPSS
jgi:serine phosphatase RsbU (regulator of sigma subunit)